MKMHQWRLSGRLGLHQSGLWGQSQSGRCPQLDRLGQSRLGQLDPQRLTQFLLGQSVQDRLLGLWGQRQMKPPRWGR